MFELIARLPWWYIVEFFIALCIAVLFGYGIILSQNQFEKRCAEKEKIRKKAIDDFVDSISIHENTDTES